MNNKGQSSQLLSIFLPAIGVVIIGACFAILISDLGSNYGFGYEDDNYQLIANQAGNLSAIGESTSEAVIGDSEDRSNILSSIERLTTGAYNAILVLGNVPGVYLVIIDVIADELQIPEIVVQVLMAVVLLSIFAVVVYLALGRL